MEPSNKKEISSLENRILELLKEKIDGVAFSEFEKLEANATLRSEAVNSLLSSKTVEMLTLKGTKGNALRLKRGSHIENASMEEQLVFSLIEEADKMGIWIRDIRDRSGLTETQLRKVLKGLEQRKLVKAVKAVGTTKKCYMLYNLEADETLTGGTFYSDQQLDSQFVQTLAQICVNLLQTKRRMGEEANKFSFMAQREASFVRSEEVAAYIHDKKICKVPLGVADIESILNVAVLDGKLEMRYDHSYRALKKRSKSTALATVPCLQCSLQHECRPGHMISPENCEYFKKYFDL